MNKDDKLLTPKGFADRLYKDQRIKVTSETIRNAIKRKLIDVEGKIGGFYVIDYHKNKNYRPGKVGRPKKY